jgi:hypothetical protein
MNRSPHQGNPLSWHCILFIDWQNKVGVNNAPHAYTECKFKCGEKHQDAGYDHGCGIKLQQKQGGDNQRHDKSKPGCKNFWCFVDGLFAQMHQSCQACTDKTHRANFRTGKRPDEKIGQQNQWKNYRVEKKSGSYQQNGKKCIQPCKAFIHHFVGYGAYQLFHFKHFFDYQSVKTSN